MMDGFIAAALVWLVAHTGYPVPTQQPEITVVSRTEIAAKAGQTSTRLSGEIAGLYNIQTGAILLPADWSAGDVWSESVLVHELDHWLQFHNGGYKAQAQFRCPANVEAEAHLIQLQWNREHDPKWDDHSDKAEHLKRGVRAFSRCPGDPATVRTVWTDRLAEEWPSARP